MAFIKKISDGRIDHLICRAKERADNIDTKFLNKKYIQQIIEILKNNTPDDWRFTKSPVAQFLIYDEESGFRILGRTYRDNGKGKDFINNLKNKNFFQTKSVGEYFEIIKDPNAKIIHELKTIYSKKMGIFPLEVSYTRERVNLPHIIPIDAKKIASRPNAIIRKNKTLWVRQNEWIKIPQELDYLLFELLTKNGINKSKKIIYTHDKNGNIESYKEYDGVEIPVVFKFTPPDGFRTASYWSLPTYIDAFYTDLKYKAQHSTSSLNSEESLLKARIEIIREKLKREFGWQKE